MEPAAGDSACLETDVDDVLRLDELSESSLLCTLRTETRRLNRFAKLLDNNVALIGSLVLLQVLSVRALPARAAFLAAYFFGPLRANNQNAESHPYP